MKFLCSAVFCIVVALGMPQMARAADVEINEMNFPDQIFRNYVVSEFDKDNNGTLSEEEMANVTFIPVSRKEITSLKGIEYFTALETLDCGYNQLTTLDVSMNTVLKSLICSGNQLTSLDISKNTALTYFWCGFNQLTSLDVSMNTVLEELYCYQNQLKVLDVSANTNLRTLECDQTQLTSLDVSKNISLISLDCSSNQLTSLDISKNISLTSLICYGNPLTKLKLNSQTYDTLPLYNAYLHRNANLSDLQNVTEIEVTINNGSYSNTSLIKVTDITKPATYKVDGKDFTILYIDPDENPEKISKITYVLDGGINADNNPATYTEGTGVASFANAVKEGYTFDGWYLDAAFTTKVTSIGSDKTGNITLYAKFINTSENAYCARIFSDYEYKNSVSGTAIILYGNCKKGMDTIKKDCILYTDILSSYNYSVDSKGKVKASTGKVIAGITMSDTKPTIIKNKIVDSEAAKIAKAKIKNGQITVTATGKAGGVVYLWIMDTGNKGVSECCPINVKLAPKKLEVQETTGNKANKLKIANGTSKEVKIAGFVGTTKTEDCTYTATVDSKSQNYVSVTTLDDKSFILKGTGLKNDKDTKVSITFTCKENGKKVKFTTTITKPTT